MRLLNLIITVVVDVSRRLPEGKAIHLPPHIGKRHLHTRRVSIKLMDCLSAANYYDLPQCPLGSRFGYPVAAHDTSGEDEGSYAGGKSLQSRNVRIDRVHRMTMPILEPALGWNADFSLLRE